VIEDDPTHSKLASLVLEAAGHKVNAVEAAEQVFSAINQDRPDVIILDLNLPIMDGLTLARKLNADPELRTIPVVVVTSYPDRFTKKDVLATGCASYVIKPIDTRTFAGLVSQSAEGRSDNKHFFSNGEV
jgi:two-component system cell cycle response regulator